MNPLGRQEGQARAQGIIPQLQHREARRTVEATLRGGGHAITHTPQGIMVLEDSANMTRANVGELLAENTYTDGFPRVLENRDPRGNLQIEFTNDPYGDMPLLSDDEDDNLYPRRDEIDVAMDPRNHFILPERNGFELFLNQLAERGSIFSRQMGQHTGGQGRAQEPALFTAVSEGDIANVATLLESGANVEAKNNDQKTPIDLAKETNNLPLVELLEKYSISLALDNEDLTKIEKLLSLKVPLSSKNYAMLWQKFPKLACETIDAYPDLAKYCPLPVLQGTSSDLKTKLIERGAIFENDCFVDMLQEDPEAIFVIIKEYPQAARKSSEKTLLTILNRDNEALFLKLIEVGARVRPDHLYAAIYGGHLKAADAIIDEGLGNSSAKFGPSETTLLCLAVEKNLGPLVDKLIKAKADVKDSNKERMTALHIATREGYKDIVKSLINAGANVLAENKEGKTPRDLAISSQHDNVAAMLLEPELAEAIKQEKAAQAKALLEFGVSKYFKDINGDTPLYLAMKHGLKECADILMSSLPKPYIEMLQCITPAKEKAPVLVQLMKAICKNPQLAHTCCSQDSTPFEVAFLLNDPPLAVQFMRQLSDEERIQGIAVLFAKYPNAISDILDLFFEVDKGHFADASLCMMTTCPPDIDPPQNLNIFLEEFTALTAADPTQKFLVYHRELSATEVSKLVTLFLKNVNNEVKIDGTSAKDSPQFKEQYKMIRVALSHVVLQLEKCKDDKDKHAKMVIDICRELALAGPICFTQYRETASMLYNRYVHTIEPTAKNAFLEQLQQLRGMIVEGMTDESYVEKSQSVHAIHYFKKILGEALQLADRSFHTEDLPYDAAGFVLNKIPDRNSLFTSFLRRYTPSVIFNHIKEPLRDEGARSQYLDWAKVHLKEFAPDKKAYKQKKVRLQEKQNELINTLLKNPELLSTEALLQYRSELEAVSKELSVELAFGLTPVQSAQEDHEEAILNWLLDKQLAIKLIPLVLALMKQKIITFRMHKEEAPTMANVLQLNINQLLRFLE